jgi:hypothetical protein
MSDHSLFGEVQKLVFQNRISPRRDDDFHHKVDDVASEVLKVATIRSILA